MGQLKEAGAAALFGSGEGPLLVAEQLALQQVFRHGGAVDGHEGPAGAWGGVVHRVGKQLLASARFADEEHRQGGETHLF